MTSYCTFSCVRMYQSNLEIVLSSSNHGLTFDLFYFHVSECTNQILTLSWKPECVGSFNMDWRILVFYPGPEARDKIY